MKNKLKEAKRLNEKQRKICINRKRKGKKKKKCMVAIVFSRRCESYIM